jgi:hypothetical protein
MRAIENIGEQFDASHNGTKKEIADARKALGEIKLVTHLQIIIEERL